MQHHLRISITFLNGTYHGRGEGNRPEWPPSPMRVFQALVAVAGAKWQHEFPPQVESALDWLASLPAPDIQAPDKHQGVPYQTSVPNNAMDIVAKAWSRHSTTSKDAQVSTHKAMKEISSTYLLPDREQPWQAAEESAWQVHYLWRLDQGEPSESHLEVLQELAACLFEVGWGLDLVAGHVSLQAEISQEFPCWSPATSAGTALRTPRPHAREALQQRHQRFIKRIVDNTLIPVPPLSTHAYEVVQYRRTDDPASPGFAAFSFLEPSGQNFHAFGLMSGMKVAGMLRHATATAARQAGWQDEVINQLVLGHGEPRQAETHKPVGRERIAYIPLPSLEWRGQGESARHVGMIRRALLYIPAGGFDAEINALRRLLSGMELINNTQQTEALISAIPASDKMVTRYVSRTGASTWSTVTPVILPGRDDRKEQKIEKLIRKAIVQAGFSQSLADQASLDWRVVGYQPGAEHVKCYADNVPQHLRQYPRYHVRITWRNSDGTLLYLKGPFVLGGGRYYGIGLMRAE